MGGEEGRCGAGERGGGEMRSERGGGGGEVRREGGGGGGGYKREGSGEV